MDLFSAYLLYAKKYSLEWVTTLLLPKKSISMEIVIMGKYNDVLLNIKKLNFKN